MKADRKTSGCRWGLAVALAVWAAPALARDVSEFGCYGLKEEAVVPAMEGKDGVFYRLATDLTLGQDLSPAAVEAVARLSAALEEAGTTLIFAPVPTKAEAMPEALPDDLSALEYDWASAQQEYRQSIRALRARGVITADLLHGMLEDIGPEDVARYGTGQVPLFFRSDYHWTSEGARRAARQIAGQMRQQANYDALPKTTFETVSIGAREGFSTMRRTMQMRCRQALPEVETMGFDTTPVADPSQTADEPLDIFADADEQVPVVLLGTSFSDNPTNNFAGWIEQYSDLEVLNYAVTGGGQFGALLSYLTSDDYARQRPAFIVWESPIYADIMQFGSGPMEELVAAADAKSCSHKLVLHDVDGTLEAQLNGSTFGTSDAIFARFGDEGPRKATFVLRTESGIERQYHFRRGDRLRATGNFWLSLAPYSQTPLNSVRVTFDRPVNNGSSLSLCFDIGE
ncbi:hypothetical protein RPE78_12875 [Thioclava litoralis]|uniref:AlgX/AlgJ SGNH hydrolase-like domain-containing protein n=1 Tax=Thioclava litoralis TaxID=3076557 RepID=A0ABZ1DXQ1_9RHOB|nr:hypothetical protein RPE78_12875 [Thioclava sp. FTW29]